MVTSLTSSSSATPAATDLHEGVDRSPDPRAAPVHVRGLTKAYGARVVVDDLDLDVHAGELVGLIGANGAGKTTTVEILQGLRRPDAGRVRVFGLDPLTDASRIRPLVGSQLQSSALPDRLKVIEAVRLFAGPDAGDVDALLEQFGLAHRRGYAFGSMSGGERQRLFLVLALLNSPRLVILDELTQGLDPAARRDVWSAVARLRESGTTVLLVTHELTDTERLCDRVIALKDGAILDQGTPGELVARHGGAVSIRFAADPTLPRDPDVARSRFTEISRLPGMASAKVERGEVVLTTDRTGLAHLGAWLIANDAPVPADLRVEVPNLEAALVRLLATPTPNTKDTQR